MKKQSFYIIIFSLYFCGFSQATQAEPPQTTPWKDPTMAGTYGKRPSKVKTLTKSKEERKKIKEDYDNYDEYTPEKSDIVIGGNPRKEHETIGTMKKGANLVTGTTAGAIGFIQQNENLGQNLQNMTQFKTKRKNAEAQARDKRYVEQMKNPKTGENLNTESAAKVQMHYEDVGGHVVGNVGSLVGGTVGGLALGAAGAAVPFASPVTGPVGGWVGRKGGGAAGYWAGEKAGGAVGGAIGKHAVSAYKDGYESPAAGREKAQGKVSRLQEKLPRPLGNGVAIVAGGLGSLKGRVTKKAVLDPYRSDYTRDEFLKKREDKKILEICKKKITSKDIIDDTCYSALRGYCQNNTSSRSPTCKAFKAQHKDLYNNRVQEANTLIDCKKQLEKNDVINSGCQGPLSAFCAKPTSQSNPTCTAYNRARHHSAGSSAPTPQTSKKGNNFVTGVTPKGPKRSGFHMGRPPVPSQS